jgi:hypothetical protein
MRTGRRRGDLPTRTFRDGYGGAPLIHQNVELDRTIGIDVGVVYLRREADPRRFVRVVGRESNQKEDASLNTVTKHG